MICVSWYALFPETGNAYLFVSKTMYLLHDMGIHPAIDRNVGAIIIRLPVRLIFTSPCRKK